MDFLTPKWMFHLPDENVTDIPKSLIQLERTLLYPARNFLQNMFKSRNQFKVSKTLLV